MPSWRPNPGKGSNTEPCMFIAIFNIKSFKNDTSTYYLWVVKKINTRRQWLSRKNNGFAGFTLNDWVNFEVY